MKKSDIALLAVIVAVSLVVAYLVGQAVLGQVKQKSVQVEATDKISSTIVEPSPSIFYRDAINPAVPINIGGVNNQQPFGQ